MQDVYAGDVGDFGKFVLLRAVEKQKLTVGINWYLTNEPGNQKDGDHSIPGDLRNLGIGFECLYNKLTGIHRLGPDKRTVKMLQQAKLLKCDHFVDDPVPQDISGRKSWHRRALDLLEGVDIVFLDPDNGLNVKTAKPGTRKSVKYVWLDKCGECSARDGRMDEISDYIGRGQGVILYQHRQRKKWDVYINDIFSRFCDIPALKGRNISVISFSRKSVRDYFVIPGTKEQEELLSGALRSLSEIGDLLSVSCIPVTSCQSPRFNDPDCV